MFLFQKKKSEMVILASRLPGRARRFRPPRRISSSDRAADAWTYPRA